MPRLPHEEFETELPPHERFRRGSYREPTHQEIMNKLEEIEDLLRKLEEKI